MDLTNGRTNGRGAGRAGPAGRSVGTGSGPPVPQALRLIDDPPRSALHVDDVDGLAAVEGEQVAEGAEALLLQPRHHAEPQLGRDEGVAEGGVAAVQVDLVELAEGLQFELLQGRVQQRGQAQGVDEDPVLPRLAVAPAAVCRTGRAASARVGCGDAR